MTCVKCCTNMQFMHIPGAGLAALVLLQRVSVALPQAVCTTATSLPFPQAVCKMLRLELIGPGQSIHKLEHKLANARCSCRPLVRSCLFQPGERQRLAKLVQQAGSDSHMSAMLESNAAVEVAAQAAISGQWDRFVTLPAAAACPLLVRLPVLVCLASNMHQSLQAGLQDICSV